MIRRPLGRDLDRHELRSLVSSLAGQPELWRPRVHHDPRARTYEELIRDAHVGVWLNCWMDDHDTGYHDHDVSAGAVVVAEGQVREERLSIGGPPVTHTFEPGQVFDFAPSAIHRVTHAGDRPAVTINAYSPPLWRMGAYGVEPSGELQRRSVSYAEELRPLERLTCPSRVLHPA